MSDKQKPIPVAPYTEEDGAMWLGWNRRWGLFGGLLSFHSIVSDRRDAALMLCLRVQAEMGTCYLRIGAENYAVPAVQVHVLKNPLFPTGAGYPFSITPCA